MYSIIYICIVSFEVGTCVSPGTDHFETIHQLKRNREAKTKKSKGLYTCSGWTLMIGGFAAGHSPPAPVFRGVKMERSRPMGWRQHVFEIRILKSFTVFMGLFQRVKKGWPCNVACMILHVFNSFWGGGTATYHANSMLNLEPHTAFRYPFKPTHGDCPKSPGQWRTEALSAGVGRIGHFLQAELGISGFKELLNLGFPWFRGTPNNHPFIDGVSLIKTIQLLG